MRYQGRLTNWNDEKGFGFVEPNGGGERAFVHIKSFQARSRRPVEGDMITYQQVKEAKNKFKASNISLVSDRNKRSQKLPPTSITGTAGGFISMAFCIVLVAVAWVKLIPVNVVLIYFGASFLAIALYAIDKSSAKKGRWRTPESHLHLVSLLGGWPGAFYAQQKLRHKSSKAAFKRVFWVTVVLNMAGFVWLLTEPGQSALNRIVG